MSHPSLLEDHLLSRCPLKDGSPSVFPFQGRFGYALPYLSYDKTFYKLFIHRCLSVTALTVAQIILRTPQSARPHVLRGFRYPTFLSLVQTFGF